MQVEWRRGAEALFALALRCQTIHCRRLAPTTTKQRRRRRHVVTCIARSAAPAQRQTLQPTTTKGLHISRSRPIPDSLRLY